MLAPARRTAATFVRGLRPRGWLGPALLLTLTVAGGVATAALVAQATSARTAADDAARETALQMFEEGRRTFRHDTFGDEVFWGRTLRLHEAIAGAENGGVGPGV